MPIVDKVVKQERVPTELMHAVADSLPDVTFTYDPNYAYEGMVTGTAHKQGSYGTTPHADVNVQVQGMSYGDSAVGSARLWVNVPFNDPVLLAKVLEILTKAGTRICKASQYAMDEHKARLLAELEPPMPEEDQQVG